MLSAMPANPLQVGWCPGVLRPMRVGDGLLIRVKPRGHRLTLAQASGLAALAQQHGNGALNVTGRGNLQLRGLQESSLPAATAALATLGLVDDASEGEAVRNVVSNPLAGFDPFSRLDLGSVVAAWEKRLATDHQLWSLPAKFSWSLDDGGSMPLDRVATDVRFAAASRRGAPGLIIGLDGAPALRSWCDPGEIEAVALRLAAAFLGCCAAIALAPHRMRDLVARCGAGAVFEAAGLPVEPVPGLQDSRPVLQVGATLRGPASVVLATPAFGFFDARTLAALVSLAGGAGASEIRLTPWRGLLVPGLETAAATALAQKLGGHGLILDPGDPRLRVATCVGQAGCRRGTTATVDDATALAALLPAGTGEAIAVHVSGCAKGCAHGGVSPVTLVGRDGAYELVLDGGAGDRAVRQSLPPTSLRTMVPGFLGTTT